jgi:hypothetical protein
MDALEKYKNGELPTSLDLFPLGFKVDGNS